MNETEGRLQEAILTLLEERDPGKTICPSEVARQAFPENWRDHMESTRAVAIELTRSGAVEICQGGEVVDASSFRGPIRLRKPR